MPYLFTIPTGNYQTCFTVSSDHMYSVSLLSSRWHQYCAHTTEQLVKWNHLLTNNGAVWQSPRETTAAIWHCPNHYLPLSFIRYTSTWFVSTCIAANAASTLPKAIVRFILSSLFFIHPNLFWCEKGLFQMGKCIYKMNYFTWTRHTAYVEIVYSVCICTQLKPLYQDTLSIF